MRARKSCAEAFPGFAKGRSSLGGVAKLAVLNCLLPVGETWGRNFQPDSGGPTHLVDLVVTSAWSPLILHVPVFVAHDIPVRVTHQGAGVEEKTKFSAPMRAKNVVVCGDAMSVNFALGICGDDFLLRRSVNLVPLPCPALQRWLFIGKNNAILRLPGGGLRQNISLRKWVGQNIDDADEIEFLRRCLPVVDEMKSDADGGAILQALIACLMDANISAQLPFFRIVGYISLPRGSEEGQDSDTYRRYLQARMLNLMGAVSLFHAPRYARTGSDAN